MPATQGYIALKTAAAIVDWPGLEAGTVTGADAHEWLQGQLTNDLRLLDSRPFVDSCLVRPTGQLLATVRVWRGGDGFVLATDSPDIVLERVDQFVILEDVTWERIGPVRSLQGPMAVRASSDSRCLESPRTGSHGWDLVGDAVLEAPLATWDDVQTVTLEAGIPLIGLDSGVKTLPPELGPAFDRAHVAYDKGCYTGQEVLQRIHSRGHTNKQWVVLSLEGAVEPGDIVRTDDGAEAGTVTRFADSPESGSLAGAMVRNAAAVVGAEVAVGSVRGRVWKL